MTATATFNILQSHFEFELSTFCSDCKMLKFAVTFGTFETVSTAYIKPSHVPVDIDVAPVRFAEYFSQLYASNNSTSLNELSKEDYDVQNETLERDFTICEVECAIKSSEMW